LILQHGLIPKILPKFYAYPISPLNFPATLTIEFQTNSGDGKMPTALIASGNSAIKNLLGGAIAKRYGPKPPALKQIRIGFKGQARAQIGSEVTWVPMTAIAYLNFPRELRWDFSFNPPDLPAKRRIQSFDGVSYRRVSENGNYRTFLDADYVASMRRRLLAMSAVLLTPLTHNSIENEATGRHSFSCANRKKGDIVDVFLRPDKTIDHVSAECLNPFTNFEEEYTIHTSPEVVEVNGVILPEKIDIAWDYRPQYMLTPIKAEIDAYLPVETFTLQENSKTLRKL
jgi:hypothetical protein